MNKSKYTYRIGSVLIASLIWEIIFWIAFLFFIVAFGYVGDLKLNEKLVFKYPENLILFLLVVPIAGIYLYNIIHECLLKSSQSRL